MKRQTKRDKDAIHYCIPFKIEYQKYYNSSNIFYEDTIADTWWLDNRLCVNLPIGVIYRRVK